MPWHYSVTLNESGHQEQRSCSLRSRQRFLIIHGNLVSADGQWMKTVSCQCSCSHFSCKDVTHAVFITNTGPQSVFNELCLSPRCIQRTIAQISCDWSALWGKFSASEDPTELMSTVSVYCNTNQLQICSFGSCSSKLTISGLWNHCSFTSLRLHYLRLQQSESVL